MAAHVLLKCAIVKFNSAFLVASFLADKQHVAQPLQVEKSTTYFKIDFHKINTSVATNTDINNRIIYLYLTEYLMYCLSFNEVNGLGLIYFQRYVGGDVPSTCEITQICTHLVGLVLE